MLSNKDINFNDEQQILTINGEKHPIGEAIAAKIGDLTKTGLTGDSVAAQLGDASVQIDDLMSGKTDRFVASESSTSQTIDVGIETASNRMFLLSAGYATSSDNYYVFGLIFISYTGDLKYVSLKDTQMTLSATYTDGIVSLTFSNHPYSKAVLIRLS